VNKDLYLLQGICQIRKKKISSILASTKKNNDTLKVQRIPRSRYIRRRERISASGQSRLVFLLFAIFSNRIWRTLKPRLRNCCQYAGCGF